MRVLVFSFAAFLLSCANLLSAEVRVVPSASPKPAQAQSLQTPVTTPAAASPQYRPALFAPGPLSIINRIDAQELARKGQKDDPDGNLTELKLVSEYPPLAGFGRAAAEGLQSREIHSRFPKWETGRVQHYSARLLRAIGNHSRFKAKKFAK